MSYCVHVAAFLDINGADNDLQCEKFDIDLDAGNHVTWSQFPGFFWASKAEQKCFLQKQMCAVEESLKHKTVLTEFQSNSGLTFVETCA